MGASDKSDRATSERSLQAVSALRGGIPSAWQFIKSDEELIVPRGCLVYALGRYGDVYGPLPVEMFHPDVWTANMLHASHDVVAVSVCMAKWHDVIPHDAQAIEARRAETLGSVEDESAVGNADAPNTSPERRTP